MRLARVAAGALVAMTVLAGCSSKEPASDTLPSAAPTSAEPSETLPPLGPPDFPMPAEAREQTPSGASAFTAYYIDLSNHLLRSLDSQPIRDLSQQCDVCSQLADGYDADRVAGYRYDGGTLSIRSAGEPMVADGRAEIAFILDQSAVTVVTATGEVVAEKSSEAYTLNGGISLTWDTGRHTWLTTRLTAERE